MDAGKREIELIRLLGKADRPLRLDAVAASLNVSEKTIRRDLRRLNHALKDTECSIVLQKGACSLQGPSRERLASLLEARLDIPETQSERVCWLAGFFLMNETASVPDLAARLYVSESTIKNDIHLVKEDLDGFGLSLVRFGQGLRLEGGEEQIRSCLLHLIRSGKISPDFGLQAMQQRRIHELVEDALDAENLALSEAGIANLFLHVQVALFRLQKGMALSCAHTAPRQFLQPATRLADDLKHAVQIELPDGEIENLAWHMAAQKRSLSFRFDAQTSQSLDKAVQKSLVEVDHLYGTGLRQDSVLIDGLVAHLSVALVRLKRGMVIENPILDDIRRQYPYAMELAQILSVRLQSLFGCMFPLTEVGYLAVHIGGSLFRGRYGKDRRKKVALVCTTGMGTSLLLLAKINDIFREQLDLTGTFTMRQATTLRPRDADLILSTVQLPSEVSLPWIHISPLLAEQDIRSIQRFIQTDGEPVPIRALFQPSLFFDHLPPMSRQEVLDVLSNRLWREGFVDETARDSFWQREQLGTTEIGNLLAVPHCMAGTVVRPAIAVAVLEKPIVWEYGMVQVVLMIAVSKEFLKKENGFFLRLYQRLNTTMKIKEFINTRHLDLLMDAFNEEDIL